MELEMMDMRDERESVRWKKGGEVDGKKAGE